MSNPQVPQPPPGQPSMPPPGGAVATPPKASGVGNFFRAFAPDPAKAPPLEWVALAIGVVLAISAFLPWATNPDQLGIGTDSGNGWLIFGAALLSIAMGFVGLSRDSISLAVGQALIGIITIVLVLAQDTSPGDGRGVSFGVFVALIAAVILTILSIYNAFDAFRKGAKF